MGWTGFDGAGLIVIRDQSEPKFDNIDCARIETLDQSDQSFIETYR